ncbi:MAG: SufD family Fe-S cluster assembly protein [Bacteroidaceae bacterium]|nr:SufD family Fe-S cluster assembly protein [Bacteroidaceae bacterium]
MDNKDIFDIQAGAQLTRFVQLQGGKDNIHITLRTGSQLDLYCVEAEGGERTVLIDLEAGARLCLVSLTLHEQQSHLSLHVRLMGEGAEASLNGAVIGSGHMDARQELLVEHCVKGCTSDMLYKQVLGGESTGLISGRVLVDAGAQKSLSEQTFASLLTSPMARAYAQPQLEIYADDVRCNHGATVGKLDEAALFYMRQRGIPEPEACLLLQHAFVGDVLQRVADEQHRAKLTALVEQRFRGQMTMCNVCTNKCKNEDETRSYENENEDEN